MGWASDVVDGISRPQRITSLDTPGQEAIVIDSLTLETYHEICYWELSRPRTITISPGATVNLGAVIACSPADQLHDWMEIASLPDVEVRCGDWHGADGEVIADGWTR
jgi:hypothetical protein